MNLFGETTFQPDGTIKIDVKFKKPLQYYALLNRYYNKEGYYFYHDMVRNNVANIPKQFYLLKSSTTDSLGLSKPAMASITVSKGKNLDEALDEFKKELDF